MDVKATKDQIFKKLITDFNLDVDIPNQQYLETQLAKLERMRILYRTQSKNPKLAARQRARARDQELATTGMITGIKFSISFWLHKDQDLMKMENVIAEPSVKPETVN